MTKQNKNKQFGENFHEQLVKVGMGGWKGCFCARIGCRLFYDPIIYKPGDELWKYRRLTFE